MSLFYAHPPKLSVDQPCLGNYGKHHHHPFVKSPIHSYVHVFVLCTVNYQIFVAGVLQEESVEMIVGAIVRADTVDDAGTADSLSPGVAGTKRPTIMIPIGRCHPFDATTYVRYAHIGSPHAHDARGRDSSTPSARQATTVPLAVVVGVVVRIRRLPQVAAMQPPGERVARGAARDQDPAERRPGGKERVGERRRCRRAPAAVARPTRWSDDMARTAHEIRQADRGPKNVASASPPVDDADDCGEFIMLFVFSLREKIIYKILKPKRQFRQTYPIVRTLELILRCIPLGIPDTIETYDDTRVAQRTRHSCSERSFSLI